MQSLVVVGDLAKVVRVGAQSVQIASVVAAHLLLLERFHESLGLGRVAQTSMFLPYRNIGCPNLTYFARLG